MQFPCAFVCGAGVLLAGCASMPVVLQPVGPCSAGHDASDTNGYLRVFSLKEAQSEGDDPIWYQHSAYRIYNRERKRIKYVGNTVGKWDESPEVVTLPPGVYTIKAQAEGYLSAVVPVLIEPGRTTAVHLESGWSPPPPSQGVQIVRAPTGYAAGWRSDSAGSSGQ